MTNKTKFEIEPAPAELPFNFQYIVSHWLALSSLPLGMLEVGELAFNPQAVWAVELIELEEEQNDPIGGPFMALTGEYGLRLSSMGGGELELDSGQAVILENFIRRIEGELKKAGHPASSDEVIDLVGRAPKQSAIIAPWKKG